MNRILLSDSYKVSHWKQYPLGTTRVFSYFESRGGRFDETTFFGLQYFLKEYFSDPITWDEITEAEELITGHMGVFNREGWEHIVEDHNGRLPLRVRAVPEGTTVPVSNVLMTVENTCDRCFWVTNYFETLLVQVWYPTTVATQSRELKKIIKSALEKSGDVSGLPFKLHDFGFRGVSSVESAGIGGAAHLVNFMGTDTMQALQVAKKFYNEPVAGFSIPASEHSTITSWGMTKEVDAFENMLDQYPTGLVACVSDSFDIFKACSDLWGTQLREKVLSREGTLVIRPDSGDPQEVITKILSILGEKFGFEVNDKGFKVLDSHVRVIWGDGVDLNAIRNILGKMMVHGWSADNIAFGMGGGLLQKLDRDTQKFAFKCSAIMIDGEWREVFKQPVTADWKVSKKGILSLIMDHMTGEMFTSNSLDTPEAGLPEFGESTLTQVVFENGELLVDSTMAEIRERAEV